MSELDAAASARGVQNLVRLLVLLAVFAAVFTTAQVAIARRYGSRAAWVLCVVAALAMIGYWLGAMATTWPELLRPLASALYMTTTFTGLPLAASTWVITRSVSRHPARTYGAHLLRGWLAFAGGVVLGAVVAVVPELIRFLA